MADNWIAGAVKHPGAFRKAAENRDMSTGELASKVTENPEDYSKTMQRRAVLAKTFSKMRHKRDSSIKGFFKGSNNGRDE